MNRGFLTHVKKKKMEKISQLLEELFLIMGVSYTSASVLKDISFAIIVVILSVIAYYITKNVLLRVIKIFTKKTKSRWDDELYEKRVFHKLSYLVPAYILQLLLPIVLDSYPHWSSFIESAIHLYMMFILMITLNAFINAVNQIYQHYGVSNDIPIKGYVQIVKIIMYTIFVILIISILINKNPLSLLAGLGAMSAVIMLIFKDTILGFVGGIQLTVNNMVRPGDWISMPKYGADGTVIDITLTTVKVQNWNKTISTIPTYSLVSDTFQNWRGMEESGGRRIKRSININTDSVTFCSTEMLERFKRIQIINKYITDKEEELREYNTKNNIDETVVVNGRRQTNIGIFREYLKAYLGNHPDINTKMTFLIRQLQPSEMGIPIEIYVFSKVQDWAEYEDIQSDIFDHIFASVGRFDLQIFQNPTGTDFKTLGK